jgi:hypothetical protein
MCVRCCGSTIRARYACAQLCAGPASLREWTWTCCLEQGLLFVPYAQTICLQLVRLSTKLYHTACL